MPDSGCPREKQQDVLVPGQNVWALLQNTRATEKITISNRRHHLELGLALVGCGILRAGTRLQADMPRYNLQVPKVVSPQRLGLLPFARISHVCEIRQRKLEGRIKDRDDPGRGWGEVGWGARWRPQAGGQAEP